ncbi:MAG: hypothetical protein JWN70_727 [Planctomycetaceae bacterium]|nr:hypothetical protein [Planctomycetaceae bacterium]
MFKDYFFSLFSGCLLLVIGVPIIGKILQQPTVLGFLVLIMRTRFSVLSGLVLLGLPFAAWAEPGMLRAVFVLKNPYQFATLTWATLMVSLMVVVTFRVTYLTGSARFGVIANAPIPQFCGMLNNPTWRHSWWIWLGCGLTIPLYALDLSLSERHSEFSFYLLPLGLGGGIVLAIGFLFVLAILQRKLIDQSITNSGLLPFENWTWIRSLAKEEPQPATKIQTNLAQIFGPKTAAEDPPPGAPAVLAKSSEPVSTGYFRLVDPQDPDSWELEPGHAQITLVWVLLACLYIGFYGAFLGAIGDGTADYWLPNQDGIFPTLFFVMIYVFFVGFTLTGTAFFLDYYRVPTTMVLVGMVLVSFSLGRVDHFYELHPRRLAKSSDKQPEISQPVPIKDLFDEQWQFPKYAPPPATPSAQSLSLQPKSTLIVVTAAGGGIQAAAWTAKVLTGLDELLGGFSESVGLVSSVSGGSVGAMFYLHHRGDRTNQAGSPMQIDADKARHIYEDASASGLEPAAWGMAFPDLVRTTFPPAAPKTLDRGLALEFEWQRRLADRLPVDAARTPEQTKQQILALKDLRLLDWSERIRARKMPAVVFNSTLVETGQRLLFSPVVTQPMLPSGANTDGFSIKASEPVEFFACYSALADSFRPNPRLVTAVRLSATFSYVSPICRPLGDDVPPSVRQQLGKRLYWHVADGGYADNEGILTATKWIEKIISQQRDRQDSRKLPFDRILIVRINGFPDKARDVGSDKGGLLNAFLGPVLTLGNVRVASQAERGDYEVQLLEEATRLRRAKKLQEAQQLLMSANDIHTKLENHLNPSGGATINAAPVSTTTVAPQVQQAISEAIEKRVDELKNSYEDSTPQVQQQVEKQAQKVEVVLEQSRNKRREYARAVEVRSLKIQFPSDMDQPPLSWALTPSDKQLIETAWEKIAASIRHGDQVDTLPEVGQQELSPQHLRYFFPLRAR